MSNEKQVCTAHEGRPCPHPVGHFILSKDDRTKIEGFACMVGQRYYATQVVSSVSSVCTRCCKPLPVDEYAGPTHESCEPYVEPPKPDDKADLDKILDDVAILRAMLRGKEKELATSIMNRLSALVSA